jgi:NAD(P)H dehydrogenase (quinone)
MNILIINFHNRNNSFCSGLAKAYESGAMEAGHEVKTLNVRDMQMEVYLHYGHESRYEPEGDILKAQELIAWCNHLALVYPTWWAGPPALMRLFFEMVFSPGFAFSYTNASSLFVTHETLLKGKTARLISTMDAPPWYYKWILGDPGGKIMKSGTLAFCGIKPIKTTYFGSVKMSKPEQRNQWLKKAHTLGLLE